MFFCLDLVPQSQTLVVSQKHNLSTLSARSRSPTDVDEKEEKDKSVSSFKFKDEAEKSVALDWLASRGHLESSGTRPFFTHAYTRRTLCVQNATYRHITNIGSKLGAIGGNYAFTQNFTLLGRGVGIAHCFFAHRIHHMITFNQ